MKSEIIDNFKNYILSVKEFKTVLTMNTPKGIKAV